LLFFFEKKVLGKHFVVVFNSISITEH